uniref:G-protein coupled receptors family 1 profile domain-containing protein n=1 Tax=Oreochromis niloticus TaxID=8128 RepID=A0A669CL93_ORENI
RIFNSNSTTLRVSQRCGMSQTLCCGSTSKLLKSSFVKYFLQGRRDPLTVTYYINLLISNLVQLCILFVWVARLDGTTCAALALFSVTANIDFSICIALERYFFITCPFLDFIRQTKGSVLVCLLVWSVCIITASLAIALQVLLRFVIHALLPAPLFIFSIAGTTKALPAATSVCTEEKRRVVATLIVLLFKYSLLNLPAVTLLAVSVPPNCHVSDTADIILFVLIPFVDLFLFFLMRKGPIDRPLAYLCCCSTDNSAADVSNKSSV